MYTYIPDQNYVFLWEMIGIASLSLIVAITTTAICMSVFGMCANSTEKSWRCTIISCVIFSAACSVCLIVLGAYILSDNADESVRNKIRSFWDQRKTKQEYWDYIQTHYQCCGLTGISDWTKVPRSCCDSDTRMDTRAECNYFKTGCESAITTNSRELAPTLAVIAFVFAGIGSLGVILLLLISIFGKPKCRR